MSTTVDRREAYYRRVAPHVAADPLAFYTRAEKGRRYLAWLREPRAPKPAAAPAPAANIVPFRPRLAL